MSPLQTARVKRSVGCDSWGKTEGESEEARPSELQTRRQGLTPDVKGVMGGKMSLQAASTEASPDPHPLLALLPAGGERSALSAAATPGGERRDPPPRDVDAENLSARFSAWSASICELASRMRKESWRRRQHQPLLVGYSGRQPTTHLLDPREHAKDKCVVQEGRLEREDAELL